MGNRSMRFIIISIFTLFLSTSCDFDVKKAQNGTHEGNSFNEIEKIHEVIISAQQGNNGASYNLGQYYIQNLGVTRNYQKAIKWLTQAVEAGNPQAQTTLEFLYFGGIPKNILNTEKIYNAAHRGDPIAQNSIGFLVLLQNSRLGLSNEYEAYDWFNKSAKQGNTYAQNNLALLYINSSRIKVDKNRAHDLLLKAAEQGNSAAQHNLGFIYLHGIGVEQNYGQAASWFAAAADQDDAEAQIALGKLYSQGLGVEKNLTKAFECFSKAAPQRYIEAQNNIGNSYLHGLGIKKDSAKALYWYTLSANQGDIWAQKNLATYTLLELVCLKIFRRQSIGCIRQINKGKLFKTTQLIYI